MKIPKLYPDIVEKIDFLIKKGFEIYADTDKDGRVKRLYGEILNRKEFKKYLKDKNK